MKKQKKNTGFITPENYFENFDAQLLGKIKANNLPKVTGFKTPENYFEGLEENILKTLKEEEKPTKVISLFPKKYFGYAAAIAASLVIGFVTFNATNTTNSNLDALQLAAIDTYIEEGNLNIDLYELTSYIDDEDITDLNLKNQQFSEVTLKDYLLENVDEETLITE